MNVGREREREFLEKNEANEWLQRICEIELRNKIYKKNVAYKSAQFKMAAHE